MATQYIEVHGVREPKLLALRERRPVPGLEDRYEVTRTGNVWSTMKKTWLKGYAEVLLHVEGQRVYAKTNYLVVLAWLSEEDRQRVRALLAETPEMDRRRVCAELAATYGVSSYALEWVGLMPAEEFRAVEVVKQRYGQVLPEPARS